MSGSKTETFRKENERLRETLAFYADRRAQGMDGAVARDAGRLARAVLGRCPTCFRYDDGLGYLITGRVLAQDGYYDETERCPDCRGSGIANGPHWPLGEIERIKLCRAQAPPAHEAEKEEKDGSPFPVSPSGSGGVEGD